MQSFSNTNTNVSHVSEVHVVPSSSTDGTATLNGAGSSGGGTAGSSGGGGGGAQSATRADTPLSLVRAESTTPVEPPTEKTVGYGGGGDGAGPSPRRPMPTLREVNRLLFSVNATSRPFEVQAWYEHYISTVVDVHSLCADVVSLLLPGLQQGAYSGGGGGGAVAVKAEALAKIVESIGVVPAAKGGTSAPAATSQEHPSPMLSEVSNRSISSTPGSFVAEVLDQQQQIQQPPPYVDVGSNSGGGAVRGFSPAVSDLSMPQSINSFASGSIPRQIPSATASNITVSMTDRDLDSDIGTELYEEELPLGDDGGANDSPMARAQQQEQILCEIEANLRLGDMLLYVAFNHSTGPFVTLGMPVEPWVGAHTGFTRAVESLLDELFQAVALLGANANANANANATAKQQQQQQEVGRSNPLNNPLHPGSAMSFLEKASSQGTVSSRQGGAARAAPTVTAAAAATTPTAASSSVTACYSVVDDKLSDVHTLALELQRGVGMLCHDAQGSWTWALCSKMGRALRFSEYRASFLITALLLLQGVALALVAMDFFGQISWRSTYIRFATLAVIVAALAAMVAQLWAKFKGFWLRYALMAAFNVAVPSLLMVGSTAMHMFSAGSTAVTLLVLLQSFLSVPLTNMAWHRFAVTLPPLAALAESVVTARAWTECATVCCFFLATWAIVDLVTVGVALQYRQGRARLVASPLQRSFAAHQDTVLSRRAAGCVGLAALGQASGVPARDRGGSSAIVNHNGGGGGTGTGTGAGPSAPPGVKGDVLFAPRSRRLSAAAATASSSNGYTHHTGTATVVATEAWGFGSTSSAGVGLYEIVGTSSSSSNPKPPLSGSVQSSISLMPRSSTVLTNSDTNPGTVGVVSSANSTPSVASLMGQSGGGVGAMPLLSVQEVEEAASVFALILNEKGVIMRCSSGFAALIGMHQQYLERQKYVTSLVAAEDKQKLLDMLARRKKAKRTVTVEDPSRFNTTTMIQLVTGAGTYLPAACSVVHPSSVSERAPTTAFAGSMARHGVQDATILIIHPTLPLRQQTAHHFGRLRNVLQDTVNLVDEVKLGVVTSQQTEEVKKEALARCKKTILRAIETVEGFTNDYTNFKVIKPWLIIKSVARAHEVDVVESDSMVTNLSILTREESFTGIVYELFANLSAWGIKDVRFSAIQEAGEILGSIQVSQLEFRFQGPGAAALERLPLTSVASSVQSLGEACRINVDITAMTNYGGLMSVKLYCPKCSNSSGGNVSSGGSYTQQQQYNTGASAGALGGASGYDGAPSRSPLLPYGVGAAHGKVGSNASVSSQRVVYAQPSATSAAYFASSITASVPVHEERYSRDVAPVSVLIIEPNWELCIQLMKMLWERNGVGAAVLRCLNVEDYVFRCRAQCDFAIISLDMLSSVRSNSITKLLKRWLGQTPTYVARVASKSTSPALELAQQERLIAGVITLDERNSKELEEIRCGIENITQQRRFDASRPDCGHIDNIAVEGEIGQGNFCTVYKARAAVNGIAIPDGIPFALKIIRTSTFTPNDMQSCHQNLPPPTQEVFDEERRKVGLLDSSLIMVYDVQLIDNSVHVAMEYAPHGSLRRWLEHAAETPALSVSKAIFAIRSILKGLAFLHGRGLHHGDLKASNILITALGEVKLSDYVSKDASLPWAAPEMLQEDEESVDKPKADIWSLGWVLVEMVNGGSYMPWNLSKQSHNSKESVDKAASMILANKKPGSKIKVSDYVKEGFMHHAWKETIRKCLQIDPAKRPTAQQLLEQDPFVSGYGGAVLSAQTVSSDHRPASSIFAASECSLDMWDADVCD